jgi:hypothetical protein
VVGFGEDFRFEPGSVIAFAGTAPGAKLSSIHGDTVAVAAVGTTSGEKAEDADSWWAWAPAETNPRIDIEKADVADVRSGVGNFEDADNNGGTEDRDTEDSAKVVEADEETTVFIRVTNLGDVNLTDIEVADATIVGDKVVDITWDAIPKVLAPGASFTGRGVLEAL